MRHLSDAALPVHKLEKTGNEKRQCQIDPCDQKRHRFVQQNCDPLEYGGFRGYPIHRYTAQQAQPSAPQKLLRSAIGKVALHERAWS